MNRITCRDLCISYNGYLAVDHVSFFWMRENICA